MTKLVDYTVQVGGPLKRDKAFFFGSVQRYSQNQNPAGPVTKQTDISPRFNMKFTLQPTASDTLILGTQYRLLQSARPRRVLAGVSGRR